MPHANWRGMYDSGTDSYTKIGCPGGNWSSCIAIDWPGKRLSAYMGPQGSPPFASNSDWFGSLLAEKADQSGLLYMRNRYYDPVLGKFTQEDPIGLAGGLNVFGYANGDPITYSDPFGLCPDDDDPICAANGYILTLTLGGSASTGAIGANFQFGLAINVGTGDMMGFAKAGPSIGLGVVAGPSVGVQYGSFNGLISATGEGGGASLTGALNDLSGTGRPSGSLSVSAGGAGVSVGARAGVGGMIDITSGGLGTEPFNPVRAVNGGFRDLVRQGMDFIYGAAGVPNR